MKTRKSISILISILVAFSTVGFSQGIVNSGGYINSTAGSYWVFQDSLNTIVSDTASHTTFANVKILGTLSGGSSVYHVTGTWTNNGIYTPSTSTVILSGNAQTINGSSASTFYHLKVAGSGLKTFSTLPEITDTLSMEETGTVSAGPVYDTNAMLLYNTATPRNTGPEWVTPFNTSNGVVIANTGAITLNSVSVMNDSVPLTINNGSTLVLGNNLTSGGDLNINSGGKLYVNASVTLTANGEINNSAGTGGLVVRSEAGGTGNLIYNPSSVNGTVQRYLVGNSNNPQHFVSSPVNNAPFSSIWTSGDYNVSIYNETLADADIDKGWVRILPATLENCKGYSVVRTASGVSSFAGSMNSASMAATVTYTATAQPGGGWTRGVDPRGWNLIGNPFPCAIRINGGTGFLDDNSSKLDPSYSALYFWDDPSGNRLRADYSSYNLLGGTTTSSSSGSGGAPGNFIPVGQGFFIKLKDNGLGTSYSTTLDFKTTQKFANTDSRFYVPPTNFPKRFWFAVKNDSGLYNETLLGFLSYATKGFDPGFDAVKLKGNAGISLYSILGDKDMVIQALPDINEDLIIPLGLDLKADDELTLFVRFKENFTAERIYLQDLLESKIIDLNVDTFYTFHAGSSTVRNRFQLIFSLKEYTGIRSEENVSPVRVFVSDNKINVSSTAGNLKGSTLLISNLLGQKVYEKLLAADGASEVIETGGLHGYYFVTLISGNTTKTVKVCIP